MRRETFVSEKMQFALSDGCNQVFQTKPHLPQSTVLCLNTGVQILFCLAFCLVWKEEEQFLNQIMQQLFDCFIQIIEEVSFHYTNHLLESFP